MSDVQNFWKYACAMDRTISQRAVQVDDPSLVRTFYLELVLQNYFTFALSTALLYYSITSFDKEVRYFWSKPRNSVSFIFFANRYVGIISAIRSVADSVSSRNAASCKTAGWINGASTLVTIVFIDYILVIRVLALYHQNRKLGTVLKCLIVLEGVAGLGIFIYGSTLEKIVVAILANNVSICGLVRPPPKSLTVISWCIPLSFGLLLLVLAVFKAAEYWRQSNKLSGFRLIAVLIRDQIIYYGFIILCCVLKMTYYPIANGNILIALLLNEVGSSTVLCIFGAQLLINLKEAGELGVNEGTNYRLQSVSDMEFAEAPHRVEVSASKQSGINDLA